MEKFLPLLLIIFLITGCGSDNVERIGVIKYENVSEDAFNRYCNEFAKSHNENSTCEYIFFDNMNTMVAALLSGRIDSMSAYETVAKYFVDNNPEFEYEIISPPLTDVFCCAMREEDVELKKEFDEAISDMSADGTLSALVKKYIAEIYFKKTPPATKFPEFYNDTMIKVGVTGDLPMLDYIRPDGVPAGFNTAILAEISRRIGKNFILVQVDSGARAAALASGKVDVIFWAVVPENTKILPPNFDKPEGAILTKSYFADKVVKVKLRKEENIGR